ncbi:MAG: arginine--tRNA ligase [Alphaproteobacteria bacterium]
MNIFSHFSKIINALVTDNASAWGLSDLSNLDRMAVEPPRDQSHGDIATNVALILAKPNKLNPRDLGQKIADELSKLDIVDTVEIAGPGFINMRISNRFWQQSVADILKAGGNFGKPNDGKDQMVNVEYVSANPTGPLHIGHCRGAVLGDAIASILDFAGYKVTKEYYVNDAGAQVDILARSTYLRYAEAITKKEAQIPEGLYPGEYLIPVGEALAKQYGDQFINTDESEYLAIFRDFSIEKMLDLIKNQLTELGVQHEVFTSERSFVESGKMNDALTELREKGIVYEGILPKPKGKEDSGWQPLELTLFRSSAYGDDVDRPLFKSDGTHTYFASDIAYHYDKYLRGAKILIDILGADHGGYVKRMQAAVKAMSDNNATLDAKLCQMVNLMDNGEPVKMSKRAGNFITTTDVVEKVGKDVVRFIMLTRSADTQLDFDLTKVIEMSKDNPVFYVQYAHARVSSVKKQLEETFADINLSDAALQTADLSLLTDEGELNIMRNLLRWPSVVAGTAEKHEPHRIANYLYETAAQLHAQWNRGNDDASLRFVILNDVKLSIARFALLRAVQNTIAIGLTLFGVEPREKM